MLDDRSYMREAPRQYWSMTTILLVSTAVCFLVQAISMQAFGGGRVFNLFALSLAGLKAGRIYQLITFQFMHASLWHLLGNSVGLFFFGRAVEEMLGAKGMLRLYLLSGTIGGFLEVALGMFFPGYFGNEVLGASAGVLGLIAAFATRVPEQPITLLVFFVLPISFPAKYLLVMEGLLALGGIFLPALTHTVSGPTANGAHLGGMLTGIVFVKWADWFGRARSRWRPAMRRRPARDPYPISTARLVRRPRKKMEDLPPAEFISREVDPILEKISAHGIHSLTDRERQILEAARSKMARRS